MDPEEARQRVDAGGTLLCMGVPAGTEMTVDLSSLVIGHKFRGIKMIPPGLHLLCWDAGRDRHAAFFFFERSGMFPTENHTSWPRVANLITRATLDRCGIPAHTKTAAGAQVAAPLPLTLTA
ncbi:hypothetical protein T484DRAFT_1809004 [Baffinella frigidus]|nr:hypothetical protein T484DRAFT_1809004 [Cryptophyta sp. CCMP2293]